jgi:hypothetical protein
VLKPTSPQSGCDGDSVRDAWRFALSLLLVALLLLPARAQGPVTPRTTRSAVLPAAATTLSGQVQDASGAIIPNAQVELERADGSVISTTSTDSSGHFRLPTPPAAADLKLKVTLAGFEPLVETVRPPFAPLTVTLELANVATSVTVNANDGGMAAAPENNQDAATVSASDMKTLPILDGDIVATLSAFLDSGATGEDGATLIVDGVEMKTLGISPSAIERVSINENPYSAQYRQPGRGQVEIITKNTADKFHGAATFTFRDSTFNATNYFSTSKAPESRRTYEGFLTGPIRPLKDTTFLFSITRQEQNSSQQLNALGTPPSGEATTGNVPQPYRNTQFTMKVAHQINDHHSAYLLYRFFDSNRRNNNVGGQTLASAGYSSYYFDMDVTFHDDDVFAPNKINQFNILFERNINRYVSNQQTPSIQVEGAFTAGGAQQDQLNTENNPNISDIVSWTTGRHQLKFGAQLPNLGRRVLEDETDRAGVYTFASLAAFAAGTPNTFTIQQGQSRFLTHYEQPGAFFLDQIQLNERLTVTPGVRYDFQNALPGTMDAVQPKLAVAYLLDKAHAMVFRTGGGVYMRRVGVNIGQQLARYQYAAEQSYLLTSNICYNPLQQCNTLSAQPPSLFNFEPNIKAPFQGYFGASLEREVTQKSTLSIGYEGYRGWHALRSIDINAPLPPFTSYTRPNPSYSQILQMNSGGIQRSDALIVSFRGRVGQYFSGFSQYTWQHARADTEFSTFQPQNQYDPNHEYGRTNADQRQRFNMFATLYPDKPVNLGIGFFSSTPQPYTETTGTDDFKTGILNARPAGVPRNSLNGGGYQDIDLRLGYTRKLKPRLKDASPTLAASLSSFNTLNRVNFSNYVGVVTSPQFMHPTEAGGQRRLQLQISYNF